MHHEYTGTTHEGIGVGSTRTDVEAIYGALEWDGAWHILIPPFGISFDFISGGMDEQYVSDIYIFLE